VSGDFTNLATLDGHLGPLHPERGRKDGSANGPVACGRSPPRRARRSRKGSAARRDHVGSQARFEPEPVDLVSYARRFPWVRPCRSVLSRLYSAWFRLVHWSVRRSWLYAHCAPLWVQVWFRVA
jgi:hypothetical protein